MNILLLGSGGREHAFAWKLSQSPDCTSLFIAPGNAGTAEFGVNLDLSPLDFAAVKTACLHHRIGMVVVGPEEPLVRGIVDFMESDPQLRGIPVIGPNASAARLEGSKAFSKRFMEKYGIPTAKYREFDSASFAEGAEYLKHHKMPVVLKADGLAAGKGVIICTTHLEAVAEFELMLLEDKFGEAGKRIVVEEFLEGIEVSVFVLTDGSHYLILPEAKDYKKVGERDMGLNTGGMGAVSPVPFADDDFMARVKKEIIDPTINGLKEEQIDYRGFIFIGVIKVGDAPLVIEYNCRMGDPETEVVIPRIKTDLVKLFQAVAMRNLDGMRIDVDPRPGCTVVAVSRGYPGSFERGMPISGLGLDLPEDSFLFQAGTKQENGEVVTNGGRVLCVTSFANELPEAIRKAMAALHQIDYDGIYYRRDIGYEFC